ncbi:hypothetical protein FE410_07715 [Leuconostoc carnosum]|uniref:hypothetical protein n=1 Tax=Leuconostoc carnosum TaxID=1252 RepID=UPI00123B4F9C|nr:hypothetical protein [Leuconostoc carnosum]KAA8369421.1 hypothetical protein FE414_07955 [Leuconostoc carnosum]KAA8380439.1 hypothetical protein FE410_07715 [Leuconostoc carnosum]
MRIKDVIGENNDLQKQLSKDNAAYYDQVITRGRLQYLWKSEEVVEPLLLDILKDILDAQRDGYSVEEVFGDPNVLLQKTMAEIPNMKFWQTLKYYWFVPVIYFAMMLSSFVMDIFSKHYFNGGAFLLSLVGGMITLSVLYCYREKLLNFVLLNNKKTHLCFYLSIIIYILILVGLFYVLPDFLVIHF